MTDTLTGGGWLEIRRRVGAGAFGDVFEAYDHRRQTRVAVKVPRVLDAEALYRFKREFRALADVRHPNLVTLLDLVSDGDEWLFSMEFVDGVDLRAHLARHRTGQPAPFECIRDAFMQIAAGVAALHDAHILHRDLKPSNVLVAVDGRVVVVDFGLMKELRPLPESTRGVFGTVMYLAPEQLAGHEATTASDWYSVGVMLYEALTGRFPPGWESPVAMFEAKRVADIAPPHELAPGVPRDASLLCQRLLDRDPRRRPGPAEIVERLGAGSMRMAATAPPPSDAPSFVGREEYLRVLAASFEQVRDGRAMTVHVHGRSGMGKTALVQHFLERIRHDSPRAMVLTGNCYERESVPYKALDSVVDDLSRHLASFSPSEAARLVPRDVPALVRLFPVLGGVESIAMAPERDVDVPNAQELRRRAAAALRELLARLAGERDVIVFIDDLQWGDADSAFVLSEILRPPTPPPLLLLLSYRSGDVGGGRLPQPVQDVAESLATGAQQVTLDVGELTTEESRTLASTLLAELGGDVARHAAGVADDSGGNPFFLGELVRHVLAGRDGDESQVSIDDMIHARTAAYPDEARRLLETVAVAGGPLPIRVARGAVGLEAEEAPALSQLRRERLVRTRHIDGRDEIETYHDRIREVIVRRLPGDALRGHHERLALSWELVGGADPETLAMHWEGAGVLERAGRYTVEAAAQAAAALAFDRAARLYRRSLELPRPLVADDERTLRIRLGDALANAGRGVAAAEAYLDAVRSDGHAPDALELRRRAAQQLLISGHIDEGLDVLGDVLRALGLPLARSPQRALVRFIGCQTLLAVRGLRFVARPEDEIPPEVMRRLDGCWAAVTGLSMADTMRAAHLQARHLILALRAGEPYRVSRALSLHAGLTALRGRRSRRRTDALLEHAERLAERLGNPHALGMCLAMRAATVSFYGEYRRALELARAGEAMLREQCTGVTWELDTAVIFQLHSLYWMGEWRELASRLPVLQREVDDRGDRYLSTYIGTRSRYVVLLAGDQIDDALARQGRSIEAWSRQGFQVQHYWDWLARGEMDLYAGGDAAWRRVRTGWRRFRGSHLDANQAIFIESRLLRARAALAACAVMPRGAVPGLMRRVARDARSIERQGGEWATALARSLHAACAVACGDVEKARTLAESAEASFTALEMGQYAAAVRYRRGQLLGGATGRRLVTEAEGWMRNQGVVQPARMVAMLVPGAWPLLPGSP